MIELTIFLFFIYFIVFPVLLHMYFKTIKFPEYEKTEDKKPIGWID